MNIQRLVLIVLALLSVLFLAGCPMGQKPIDPKALGELQPRLEEIDRLPAKPEEINSRIKDLRAQLSAAEKAPRVQRDTIVFLIGYAQERLGDHQEAIKTYESLSGSPLKSMAFFRIGEIAANAPPAEVVDIPLATTDREAKKDADKIALRGYSGAGGYYPTGVILVRYPALASEQRIRWQEEPLRKAANERADHYQREFLSYKAIDALVSLTGRNKSYSYALALIIIALVVKLITTPLTMRQFKSMREMQAIQPLLAELQKKYKGDKEGMMREQMKLFREHKINPLGGCLPLLVQMPFLIWVWRAVAAYSWQFEGASFLWISNLAEPNYILLVLYAISMYFSQKLTTPPSADPQQQQMSRMMAIMMPFMFLFMFQTMAAAFILYWFAQNVLMTAHQYYMYKKTPPPSFAAQPEAKVIKRK